MSLIAKLKGLAIAPKSKISADTPPSESLGETSGAAVPPGTVQGLDTVSSGPDLNPLSPLQTAITTQPESSPAQNPPILAIVTPKPIPITGTTIISPVVQVSLATNAAGAAGPSLPLIPSFLALASSFPTKINPDDEIILLSSDGIIHPTSRSLLSTYSPFFDGMFSTCSPSPSPSDKPEPIPLPSAPSGALALVLAVLVVVRDKQATGVLDKTTLHSEVIKHQSALSVAELRTIAEAVALCRIYDIPKFETAFLWPVLDEINHPPIIGYTLTAITRPRTERRHSLWAGTALRSGITRLPPDITTLLLDFAPQHHHIFNTLLPRYLKSFADLRFDLQYGPITDGGGANFVHNCGYGSSGWRYSKNPTGRWPTALSWDDARGLVADAVHAQIIQPGDTTESRTEILAIVKKVVGCGRCARRLTHMCDVPVQRFRSVPYEYTLRPRFCYSHPATLINWLSRRGGLETIERACRSSLGAPVV